VERSGIVRYQEIDVPQDGECLRNGELADLVSHGERRELLAELDVSRVADQRDFNTALDELLGEQ